jgi:hypothetical protein
VASTKYSPLTGPINHRWAYRALRDAPSGAHAGREAPLVLIEEHLTVNIDFPLESYRPASCAGRLLQGWSAPVEGIVPNKNGLNFVSKIQPFNVGGYELSVRSLDLEKIGRAVEFGGCRGKREAPEVPDQLNLEKSAARAKRRVRYLVKNMGATHLVTFSIRESIETIDSWYTPEDWSKAWDKLRRLIVKAKGEFPYVAVLEKHKKGNYHLHVAWVEAPGQKVNINLVRSCWWAVLGGRGKGNVDAQFIKVRAGLERSDRVARYISKYTTKNLDVDCRFNKKKYWASRQQLPSARRTILRASDSKEALDEVLRTYGINLADYVTNCPKRGLVHQNLFFYPDGSGFWINYIPELNRPPDIPF